MGLLLLSGTTSLFALEPDEKSFVYNAYGGQNAPELKIVLYKQVNGEFEAMDQEAAFPLAGSIMLYPGYYQHTYSKVLGDFVPNTNYRADYTRIEDNVVLFQYYWTQGM
jgi:hypothetical protein